MSDTGRFDRVLEDIREAAADGVKRIVDESQRLGEDVQTRYKMWEVKRSIEREYAVLGQLVHQLYTEGSSLDVSQDSHCRATLARIDSLEARHAELRSTLTRPEASA